MIIRNNEIRNNAPVSLEEHEVEEHPPLLSLWAVLQHGVEQLGGLAGTKLPGLEEQLQLLEVGEGVRLQ